MPESYIVQQRFKAAVRGDRAGCVQLSADLPCMILTLGYTNWLIRDLQTEQLGQENI